MKNIKLSLQVLMKKLGLNGKRVASSIFLALFGVFWNLYFSFSEIIAQKGFLCQEFWLVAIVAFANTMFYFLNKETFLEIEQEQWFKKDVYSAFFAIGKQEFKMNS